jgi:hypothetical protein
MIGWCLRCSVYPRRWPALTSTPGGTTAGCCWPSPREGPPRTSGKALLRQAWARRENSLKDRASISIGGSFKPSSRQICVWISSAIASTFTKITFPWKCKSKSIWQWWDGRYKVTDFSLIKKNTPFALPYENGLILFYWASVKRSMCCVLWAFQIGFDRWGSDVNPIREHANMLMPPRLMSEHAFKSLGRFEVDLPLIA